MPSASAKTTRAGLTVRMAAGESAMPGSASAGALHPLDRAHAPGEGHRGRPRDDGRRDRRHAGPAPGARGEIGDHRSSGHRAVGGRRRDRAGHVVEDAAREHAKHDWQRDEAHDSLAHPEQREHEDRDTGDQVGADELGDVNCPAGAPR